jgi:hypothetical protein
VAEAVAMSADPEKTCIRCGRDAPPVESDEYVAWEADEDGYLICPGCLTGEEHRWMDEEDGERARAEAEAQERDLPADQGGDA